MNVNLLNKFIYNQILLRWKGLLRWRKNFKNKNDLEYKLFFFYCLWIFWLGSFLIVVFRVLLGSCVSACVWGRVSPRTFGVVCLRVRVRVRVYARNLLRVNADRKSSSSPVYENPFLDSRWWASTCSPPLHRRTYVQGNTSFDSQSHLSPTSSEVLRYVHKWRHDVEK